MSRVRLLLGIILTVVISISQVGEVFAAPASQASSPISGAVKSITLEADPTTGVVTVIVELVDSNQVSQKVRLSEETASSSPLGLVVLNADGNPVINELALGKTIEIDPAKVIPEQERQQHPVGSALATFFSDIEGVDYNTIMAAHEDGVGFGIIAQALWLTSELAGDSELFQSLIDAKVNNDYSAFSDFTDDGTTPKNWGQLRRALLDKKSLGLVMSKHENQGNQGVGNGNTQANKNKDKSNNGHGNGNGNGNGPNK